MCITHAYTLNFILGLFKKIISDLNVKGNNIYTEWILLSLKNLYFLGGDSSAWLKPWMKTSYSCQGDVLNLTCPHNLVIKVKQTFYK